MDGNLHAGKEIIKEDPNEQNLNGKLFSEVLQQNPSMFLVNGTDKCHGDITRLRVIGKNVERDILDFVLKG